MRVYVLVSSEVPDEAIDLYVSRKLAELELRKILDDEPGWVDVLRLEPIELDELATSFN